MIEENNQKMAAEQLQPEFERITALTEANADQLAALKGTLSEAQQQFDSKLQELSFAFNKTQGDMGLLQIKMADVQKLCVEQETGIKTARSMVETQQVALLTLFRRQQAELDDIIKALVGEQVDVQEK